MIFDTWTEIFEVLARNRLRTLLTALSVAWGIFMLVILLGAGKGLQNGVEQDFKDDAVNSVWIQSGKTSLPYQGLPPGREIRFTNGDLAALRSEVGGIEYLTGRYHLWGGFQVSYQKKTGTFDLRGCHPDHRFLEGTLMLRGRFINDTDIKMRRKVAVISPEIQRALFDTTDPLGEFISIRGVNYRVVGLYHDEGSQNELNKIYIPISTAQLVYHGGDRVHAMMYTVGNMTAVQSEVLVERTRELLAKRHDFSLEDKQAVRLRNNLAQFQKLTDVFTWVNAFVWLVGAGTLFAGMVGVSNIMLISVKERTREFGIRKALGASPWSILSMILQESLFVTALAGYVGLVAGTLLLEAVNQYIPENDYVRNPTVDFKAAIGATLLLIVIGAIAGLIPALRAARIKPVAAIREG